MCLTCTVTSNISSIWFYYQTNAFFLEFSQVCNRKPCDAPGTFNMQLICKMQPWKTKEKDAHPEVHQGPLSRTNITAHCSQRATQWWLCESQKSALCYSQAWGLNYLELKLLCQFAWKIKENFSTESKTILFFTVGALNSFK